MAVAESAACAAAGEVPGGIRVATRLGDYWDVRGPWSAGPPRWSRAAAAEPDGAVGGAMGGTCGGGIGDRIGEAGDGEPALGAPTAREQQTTGPVPAGAAFRRGDAAPDEPAIVDVGSPEYAHVWRPVAGGCREPRPGVLKSVVRARGFIAYPVPVAPTVLGAVLPVEQPAAAQPPAPAGPPDPRPAVGPGRAPQAHTEVRTLVAVLVDALAGRRTPDQVAHWLDEPTRAAFRSRDRVRFSRTATVRRVRLAAAGPDDASVEAMALVQDGARLRAVALRFDRVAAEPADQGRGPGWRCTAFQAA